MFRIEITYLCIVLLSWLAPVAVLYQKTVSRKASSCLVIIT